MKSRPLAPLLVACVSAAWATPATASSVNVVSGKPVVLAGTFGSPLELASTVTDRVFLPKNSSWDLGTVWWDGNLYPDNYLEIDLEGTYQIDGFIVQADDNDAYVLEYRAPDGGWSLAMNVPNYDFEPFGMQTRPNPLDDAQPFILSSPLVATALRFYGDVNDGDRFFSVSEIQGTGVPIAEPAGGVLVASAAILLATRRRRRACVAAWGAYHAYTSPSSFTTTGSSIAM